jgi:hypothetical protein
VKKVLLSLFLGFSAQLLVAQTNANPSVVQCLPQVTAPVAGAGPEVAQPCATPTPTPPPPVPTPTPVNGTIEPKYVVLTVTYAPPGAGSSVTYSNSTMMGTSLSLSNSFTSTTSQTTSGGGGVKLSIFGISLGGGVSATSSTQFTQETDSSSSIAVNQTATLSTVVPGPSSSAQGLNHDVDLVWIWLNPVLNFSMSSSGAITWTGFTFDLRDPAGEMDVIGIPVAFLNGHQTMPANIADVLARRWAPRVVCVAGSAGCGTDGTADPGLTASDLAAILTADPFSNPSYVINIPAGSSCTADARFCRTTNQNLLFSPPPAGGQPTTQSFSVVRQTTATEGQGASDTRQTSFSTDLNASVGFFVFSFNADLKTQDTLTWTNKWSALSTQQVGQTASLTVKGPASTDNYTGPVEFEVFQDNVYGTFMFGFIPEPTFTLSASPASQSVIQGGACTSYTASVGALVSGFASTVNFNVSGLPANATASFSPASIAGAGSSTLTVCAPSTTPVGTSTLTINATSGIEIHSTTVSLTVNAPPPPPPPPNFTISATPSFQSITRGSSAFYTVSTAAVSGFTGTETLTVTGLPSGGTGHFTSTSIATGGSTAFTVSTSTTTTPGTYSLVITGTSGSLAHSVTVSLTITGTTGGCQLPPQGATPLIAQCPIAP